MPEYWRALAVLSACGWMALVCGLVANLRIAAHVTPSRATEDGASGWISLAFFQVAVGIPVLIAVGLVLAVATGVGRTPLLDVALRGAPAAPVWRGLAQFALPAGLALGVVNLIAAPPQNIPRRSRVLWAVYTGVHEELVYRLLGIGLLIWLGRYFLPSLPTAALTWAATGCVALFGALNQNPAFGIAYSIYGIAPPTPAQRMRAVVLSLVSAVAFGWLYTTIGLEAGILAHLLAGLPPALRPTPAARFTAADAERLNDIVAEMEQAATMGAIERILEREQVFLRSGIVPFVLAAEERTARGSSREQALAGINSVRMAFGQYYLRRILDGTFAPRVEVDCHAWEFTRDATP